MNKITTKYDVKHFFEKDKTIYFWFIIFLIFGIVLGIILSISNGEYIYLLRSRDNIFFKIITGDIKFKNLFFSAFAKNLLMLILLFLFGLNFYLSFASFFMVGYQSSLLVLNIVAIISEYGFRGGLLSLFILIPINLVFMIKNIIFSTCCISRSYLAKQTKNFGYGFSEGAYWLTIASCIIFDFVFSFAISMVLVLFFKSYIIVFF